MSDMPSTSTAIQWMCKPEMTIIDITSDESLPPAFDEHPMIEFEPDGTLVRHFQVFAEKKEILSPEPPEQDPMLDDPFDLGHHKYYDHILGFLDVKDILNLSQTSKSFYKLIGEYSPDTMDRIKLVIAETRDRRFTSTLNFSTRKYKHIYIQDIYDKTDEMKALIERHSASLVTLRTCYDIPMDCSMKALEDLFFLNKDLFNDKKGVKLQPHGLLSVVPNLKRLTVWGHVAQAKMFVALVRKCWHLEKLVLEHKASLKTIHEFSRHNDYIFKLHTLHVGLMKCEEQNSIFNYDDLLLFLGKQGSSLRELKFGGPQKFFIDVLTTLPMLERVTYAPGSFDVFFKFPSHTGLKEVNLLQPSHQFLKSFLRGNPSIETLYISTIDREMFKMVVNTGWGVRRLKFACISGTASIEELKELFHCVSLNVNPSHSHPPMEIIQI